VAFDVQPTLHKILSYLEASGHFGGAQIGDPISPPDVDDLYGAAFMSGVGQAELTLDAASEVHVVILRIYRNMLDETVNVEMDISAAVSNVLGDLLGDYDLGATIRAIDVQGIYGAAVAVEYGYLDFGGKMYRHADITLPLIVNDVHTTAA